MDNFEVEAKFSINSKLFDFVKVQNLFFGETLMALESKKLQVNIKDGKYELVSKKRNPIFEIKYSIDPDHFKVVKEEITHVGKNQNLYPASY